MPNFGFQTGIIFVYFAYGLSFFSMGLAITLEFGRAPLLAEARVLRPLAVFGLLHGFHEWLEIFILADQPMPVYWSWIRLGLLAVSFVSLVAYGVQVLRPPKRLAAMDAWIGAGLLTLYIALVVLTGASAWREPALWIGRADALARYTLAVPGALLASAALYHQAWQVHGEQGEPLAISLRWAAFGFAFYAFTQILPASVAMFPANRLNADWFYQITGIPIQAIRTVLALVITASLIRATQIVEKERQRQLVKAQADRLEALERVQEELVKREKLRQKLLRHIVIAQEDDRARIARELHDETAQLLTAFSLDLMTLKNRIGESADEKSLVDRLHRHCHQMSRRLYRLVHDLRPAQLDDLGLVPAVQHLVDVARRRMDAEVQLDMRGTPHRLDNLVETVFFRVIQEALTNVARHAEADEVFVRLEFTPQQVALSVEDNGNGFELNGRNLSQLGLGIAGMEERLRSVGGQIEIKSSPGAGTKIIAAVTLDETTVQKGDANVDGSNPSLIG